MKISPTQAVNRTDLCIFARMTVLRDWLNDRFDLSLSRVQVFHLLKSAKKRVAFPRHEAYTLKFDLIAAGYVRYGQAAYERTTVYAGSVARSRICRTAQVLQPVNSVAARVTPTSRA